MIRRLLRIIRWVAPPTSFLAWSYRAYRRAAEAAIPAFGAPEPMVARWRAEMLEELGLGLLLLALWVAWWAWPKSADRPSRRRERGLS